MRLPTRVAVYLACATMIVPSFSAVPATITYQGSLKQNGTPVNGQVTISVNVVDANGTPCWTGPALQIMVKEGLYHYDLTPTTCDLNSSQLYVQTLINSNKLTPPEPLNSVPYALMAKDLAAGATVKGDLNVQGKLGVGTVSPTQQAVIENTDNATLLLRTRQTVNDRTIKLELQAGAMTAPFVQGPTIKFSENSGTLGYLSFVNNANIEVMRLLENGKVGIGTSDPTQQTVIENVDSPTLLIRTRQTVNDRTPKLELQAGSMTASFVQGPTIKFSQNAGTLGYLSFVNNSDIEVMRLLQNGNIGMGTSAPTTALDVNSNTVRVRNSATPTSSHAACDQGSIQWDGNYVYVCVAQNTWKRAGLNTW